MRGASTFGGFMKKVKEKVIDPTIAGLGKDKLDYKGFIFFGLIKVNDEQVDRNKKIFIIALVIFFIIMAIIAYDMASRTTLPGTKKYDKTDVESRQE